MNKIAQFFKSKTINFSVVLAVAGAIQSNAEQIRAYVPAEAYGWILMGVGVVVAALRAVTTKPISEK